MAGTESKGLQVAGNILVKQECELELNDEMLGDYEGEDYKHGLLKEEIFETAEKLIEAKARKASKQQVDRDELQLSIIKDEIVCEFEEWSVTDLDLLRIKKEVSGSPLRRSTRKRLPPRTEYLLRRRTADGARDTRTGGPDTGGRSYTCEICDRDFSRLQYLRRHTDVHSEEKLHACSLCGKAFRRSDNLKQHELTHAGERRYECEVCGKSFSQHGHLTGHRRLHTGERPYGCDICGKTFRMRGYLKEHMRLHTGETPFACSDCGKSFSQRAHLTVHVRLHTGERPFKCGVCGKGFIRSDRMKLHALVHRGKKKKKL